MCCLLQKITPAGRTEHGSVCFGHGLVNISIRMDVLHYLTSAVNLGRDTYGDGISSEVTTWLDNMPSSC